MSTPAVRKNIVSLRSPPYGGQEKPLALLISCHMVQSDRRFNPRPSHRLHRSRQVMDSGQYKGLTYEVVVLQEAHYFFWGATEKRPSAKLNQFIRWAKESCDIDYDNKALRIKATQRVALHVPQAYE